MVRCSYGVVLVVMWEWKVMGHGGYEMDIDMRDRRVFEDAQEHSDLQYARAIHTIDMCDKCCPKFDSTRHMRNARRFLNLCKTIQRLEVTVVDAV